MVIAIIAILAAMLLPAMATAREKAKRVACKNVMRQALLTVHMYANDYLDFLPDGRDNNNEWHAIRIKYVTYTNMLRYINRTNFMDCPNFNYGAFNRYSDTYGYLIGNCYLGYANMGAWQTTSPYYWYSAKKNTDSPTNYIIADANTFGGSLLAAPHRSTGPWLRNGVTFINTAGSETPETVGGEGGNLGLLDGSVSWVKRAKWRQRYASSYQLYYAFW